MKLIGCLAVFLLNMIGLNAKGENDYDPVPTFFNRKHPNGSIVDASLPGFHLKGPFNNNIDLNNMKATLKVWPEEVENAGQVTVLWEGIPNPSKTDKIGYYCPYYDNPTHGLDYIDVTKSPTWQEGYGYYTVKLYNMRAPCAFRYYNGGKTLVAISNKVRFTNGDIFAPLQVHLAMTGKETEMRVMWNSAEVSEGIQVRYGKTKDLDKTQTKYTVKTYKASDMCESPANTTGFWDAGYIYDVLLTDLEPNTRYYYSCGSKEFMTSVYNFTTVIKGGDKTPFKFIAFGDMGITSQAETTTKSVRQEIENNDVKFVYHAGDISYARGYAYLWDQWFHEIQPMSALAPYMINLGNHEYQHIYAFDKDPSHQPMWHPSWYNGGQGSFGECAIPMVNRFHMPDNGLGIFWHSYNVGFIHMVSISSEHDYREGSLQYRWLENDLKNVDRTKTPFVIVSAHRPMYCSEYYPGPDWTTILGQQQYLEDLLYKYQVDVGLWAHYHIYERTCKVYRNECREDGITHLVVGTGGVNLEINKWFTKEWSKVRDADFGYGRFSVTNSTHLWFEFVKLNTGKVGDSVWITK
ncbi:uncharacterized protein [Clytia hemisphaerica]|uniref:Purple acid phosphatase n=1 Tax=Clytia hemisphaerica TaxID=252671 RepID=A0A7M5WXL8_9CNID